jgi:hypothetical protein
MNAKYADGIFGRSIYNFALVMHFGVSNAKEP